MHVCTGIGAARMWTSCRGLRSLLPCARTEKKNLSVIDHSDTLTTLSRPHRIVMIDIGRVRIARICFILCDSSESLSKACRLLLQGTTAVNARKTRRGDGNMWWMYSVDLWMISSPRSLSRESCRNLGAAPWAVTIDYFIDYYLFFMSQGWWWLDIWVLRFITQYMCF
jgi:hypothetical protein